MGLRLGGEVSSEYVAEHALATFRETEGTTLIVPWERAEEFDVCSEPMARITLNIHSSLEAVGLTAAVSQALASRRLAPMWLRVFITIISSFRRRRGVR